VPLPEVGDTSDTQINYGGFVCTRLDAHGKGRTTTTGSARKRENGNQNARKGQQEPRPLHVDHKPTKQENDKKRKDNRKRNRQPAF
jgi:hypothetical protein